MSFPNGWQQRLQLAFAPILRRVWILRPRQQMLMLAGNRLMKMQPGMVFDNLLPGEEVGMIDSNRPNSMLEQFRNSQLRAVAAGTLTSFSSIAKDYNGTFVSRRQELIEQWISYEVLTEYVSQRTALPIWERFVKMAKLSNNLKIDDAVNPRTLTDAGCYGQAMPSIDPLKEANAEAKANRCRLKSRAQSIRERGGNPQDVFNQIKKEREEDAKAGLSFSTNPSPNQNQEPEDAKEEPDEPDESGNADEAV